MKTLLVLAFLLGSLLAAGLHMLDNQDTLPAKFLAPEVAEVRSYSGF